MAKRKKLTAEEKARKRIERPGQSDLGPPEPLLRGERIIEPASDKGAPRRAINADRFWHTLTSEQQAAAQLIDTAWRFVTSGLLSRAQRYERVDPGSVGDHVAPHVLDCRIAYLAWTERAGGARVEVVLDYVTDGRSCREIDALRRMRSGKASEIIRAELDDVARAAPKVVGSMRRQEAA